MHAAEFLLLSAGEFGLLAAQFPLDAGDVHALAGAHAAEIGFELGARRFRVTPRSGAR